MRKSSAPPRPAVRSRKFNSRALNPVPLNNVKEDKEEDACKEKHYGKKNKNQNYKKVRDAGDKPRQQQQQYSKKKYKTQYQYMPLHNHHRQHHPHHKKWTIPQLAQQQHESLQLSQSTSEPNTRKTFLSQGFPKNQSKRNSRYVAERTRDSRLRGSDLYVARLGKATKMCNHEVPSPTATPGSDGSELSDSEAELTNSTIFSISTDGLPPPRSLHDELSFLQSPERLPQKRKAPLALQPTAVHSRPCYRCILYMYSAGIKRVFWSDDNGEWEGGKVRDLVDALEGTGEGSGEVFVTKHEVLRLRACFGRS